MINIDDKQLMKFQRLAESAIETIKRSCKAQGRWATGRTVESLKAEAKIEDDKLKIRIYWNDSSLTRPAIEQLETGRKEGHQREYENIPWLHNQLPPVKPLQEWLKIKGFARDDKEAKKKAFGLAVNIAREGTKEYRRLGGGRNEMIFTRPLRIFDNNCDKYVRQLGYDIQSDVEKELNKIV